MALASRDMRFALRGKRLDPIPIEIRRARRTLDHARQGILSRQAMGLVSRGKSLDSRIKDFVATIKGPCHANQGVMSHQSKIWSCEASALNCEAEVLIRSPPKRGEVAGVRTAPAPDTSRKRRGTRRRSRRRSRRP